MDSSGQPSDAAPSPASNSARPIPPPSGASPSVDSASPPKIEDRNLIPVPSYAWITGNNPALVHLRKIASGGFGHVHEVKDINTGNVFARKVVHPTGRTGAQAVLDEQRAIIRLCDSSSDTNVVQVLGHGWLSNSSHFYFDMELCDFNLHDYIYQSWAPDVAKKVPNFANADALGSLAKLSQIYNIMIDICNGVAFIHGSGYIHRDIKPNNVLYACNQRQWKIADFGLTAEGATDRGPDTRHKRGTEGYRAPEMLLENSTAMVTNKCDIWCIGVTLYEMLHRQKPFENDLMVLDYCRSHQPDKGFTLPIIFSTGIEDETSVNFLTRMLHSTLNTNESQRLSARELAKLFKASLMELLSNAAGTHSVEGACSQRPIPRPRRPGYSHPIGYYNKSISAPINGTQLYPAPNGNGISNLLSELVLQNFIGTTPISNNTPRVGPSIEVVPVDGTLKALEATLEIRKRVLGASNPNTLKSMRTLADRYGSLGHPKKAIAMLEERVKAASDIYKPEDPRLIIIKNDLALGYSNVKDFVSAARVGEEINEILPLAFSAEDTSFLTMRYNLGYYYEFLGKLSESAAIYEEVIAIFNRLKQENRTLQLALTGLENVYTRMGRYNDAARVCANILQMQEQSLGEENWTTLWTMKVLAGHYKMLRRKKDAVQLYKRIFNINERVKGPEHQNTLNAMSDLARAFLVDGQKDEAKKLLKDALAVREKVYGGEHPDTLELMDEIALLDLGEDVYSLLGTGDLNGSLQDLINDLESHEAVQDLLNSLKFTA